MTGFPFTYRTNIILSFLISSMAMIAAIVWNKPWMGIIPFLWLLLPSIYQWVVVQPEKLFWLLLLLLPLSTELNITPSLGLDFPDEPLLLLLTGIVLVKLMHEPRWFPDEVKFHPLFFVLVIYFLWLIITCCYSAEPLLSVKYLLAKIWYIVPLVILPAIIVRSREHIKQLATCLLLPMLFVVAFTLARHALWGFSFEKINKVLFPFFRNHVNYSSMLVCLLAVGWCCRVLTPKQNKLRTWINIALFTGAVALLFAYSRGAWLALLAGVAAVWLIRKKKIQVVIVLAVLAVLLSTAWLITDKRYMRFAPDHDHTVFHTDFSEHLTATIALKDVSNAERFYRWIAGARMLAEKPITGFGPNTFYLHYRPYTINRFETWVSNNPEHSTVHNYFILAALEQGLPGLVIFLGLYFGMLLRIQQLYHRFQNPFYKQVTLTTGVVLVMIGVINSLSDMIETDKIGGLFWLSLGMIIVLEGKLREERELIA